MGSCGTSTGNGQLLIPSRGGWGSCAIIQGFGVTTGNPVGTGSVPGRGKVPFGGLLSHLNTIPH